MFIPNDSIDSTKSQLPKPSTAKKPTTTAATSKTGVKAKGKKGPTSEEIGKWMIRLGHVIAVVDSNNYQLT